MAIEWERQTWKSFRATLTEEEKQARAI